MANAHTILWEVNARRDIIFLDQRGTSGQHRLSCEPIPFEVAGSAQQQVEDWMKACLSGLNGDPRFYTTAEAMRDLDAARAALGYDKINLYGISYGVAAIQVYMRMFPERVRAAMLDHGTALDLPFVQALPRASQSAYPGIRGDWKAVIDRLAKGPVVTSYIPPGADAPGQVDFDGFVDGVHNLMYRLRATTPPVPIAVGISSPNTSGWARWTGWIYLVWRRRNRTS